MDSHSPAGRSQMQLLAMVSGYCLDWMPENISDNLQRRMEDGPPMGKAPSAWAYVTDREGEPRRLVRVEDQGRWLLVMKDMYLAGHSIATMN